MEILLTLVTVLLPPAIAVAGCFRRNLLDEKMPLVLQYLEIAAKLYLAVVLTFGGMNFLFTSELAVGGETGVLVACVWGFCFPLIREFVRKYVHVTVELHEKK